VFLDPEMPVNTNKHYATQFIKGSIHICIVRDAYSNNSPNYAKCLSDECPISPTLIYYDSINSEILEYHHYNHSNIKSIYHLISTSSKQEFQSKYFKLPKNLIFMEFKFDDEQVNHLNYRCEDIWNSITKNDLKKAKMKKLNIELLKSKNMNEYFQSHPDEKNLILKSIQENNINITRPSVSYLPEYLIKNNNKNIIEQVNILF
jgi:hypothetical protein